MADIEFLAYGKTPRLFREIVVTEKIDGTNACVRVIAADAYAWVYADSPDNARLVQSDSGELFFVVAQSRKRVIVPGDDNFGFAQWVWNNADSIVRDLGQGMHFGEWWGKGIQRAYGMTEKRFSLFNTLRWQGAEYRFETEQLDVVPVLYQGTFDMYEIDRALDDLRMFGSVANPDALGTAAEGVVVYHRDAGQVFKILIENDHLPKSVAERVA